MENLLFLGVPILKHFRVYRLRDSNYCIPIYQQILPLPFVSSSCLEVEALETYKIQIFTGSRTIQCDNIWPQATVFRSHTLYYERSKWEQVSKNLASHSTHDALLEPVW